MSTDKMKGAKVIAFLGGLFLFLINAFPFKFYSIKLILMSILIFVSLNIFLNYKNTIKKFVLNWYLVYILYGIFFSFVAYFIAPEQLSNTIKTSTINIIWPIFYMLLMPIFFTNYNIIKTINQTLIYSAIFVGCYIFLGGMSYLGLIPIPQSLFINTTLTEGKYDAVVQLSDPSITSLMYLIPFVLSYYILKIKNNDNIGSPLVVMALMLTLIAMVISGRRALILNLLLAPCLLYLVVIFSKLRSDKSIRKSLNKNLIVMSFLLISTFLIMTISGLMNFDALKDSFIQSFDLSSNSKDESSEVRGDQVAGLIKSFQDNPIIGSGLGTGSKYVIRNYEVPSAFEMSYFAILYQTGIIGFFIYMGLLITLCFKLFNLISKKTVYIIPHLVGLISFLIANASNPYLGAFDHLWTIFLPLGIINYCVTRNKKYGNNSNGYI